MISNCNDWRARNTTKKTNKKQHSHINNLGLQSVFHSIHGILNTVVNVDSKVSFQSLAQYQSLHFFFQGKGSIETKKGWKSRKHSIILSTKSTRAIIWGKLSAKFGANQHALDRVEINFEQKQSFSFIFRHYLDGCTIPTLFHCLHLSYIPDCSCLVRHQTLYMRFTEFSIFVKHLHHFRPSKLLSSEILGSFRHFRS